jgi:menaquinone-specific isochorismate synthase
VSVYWSEAAPENALFAAYPFSDENKTIFLKRIYQLPKPVKIKTSNRLFTPSQEIWTENVLKSLNNKHLKKVVLARECMMECDTIPDPWAITAALCTVAKNSIVFCFANDEMAFLGATPELLFSRKGRRIQCEAIAGTAPLGKEVLNEKTKSELLPVIEYIQQNLAPYCIAPMQVSPVHIRATSHVQHLCVTLQGTLKAAVTDDQIIQVLHPTPALCGVPKKDAMRWIEECETFDRGMYGGIVGWSTQDEAVWAVAIRSCLIQGNRTKLYAGAGIVAGSDPSDEWEELNHKMKLFQDIFL